MTSRAQKRLCWIIGFCLVAAGVCYVWVLARRAVKIASARSATTQIERTVRERWFDTGELPPGEVGDSYVVGTNAAFLRWLNASNSYFPGGEGDHVSQGIALAPDAGLVDPWGTPFRIAIQRSGFQWAERKDERQSGDIFVESAGPDRDFLTKRDNPHSF